MAVTSAKARVRSGFYGWYGVHKVKKDGIIQKCTTYACIGVDLDGQKEVLSLHIGAVESAKYWVSVMNDLKSRGVQDVLIFCTDNLTGISNAIKACYPQSDHQKCIVHQIRNSVKHVGYKDLKEVCANLKKNLHSSKCRNRIRKFK